MSSFDSAAKKYDQEFTHSLIGKAQRKLVWRYLIKLLKDKAELNILEVNCGTGEDALTFSNDGHQVTASDLSLEMLQVARLKLKGRPVKTLVLDINNPKLNENEKYDLIFSNFGGLNCVDPTGLNSFIQEMSMHLRPAGFLVGVIMPSNCIWDKFYFLTKGKFKEINRRSKNSIDVKVEQGFVTTYYHNVETIKKYSQKNYNFIDAKPIGFFIPPSYLNGFFKNKPKLLKFLEKIDGALANQSILANYSDHFIFSIKKK